MEQVVGIKHHAKSCVFADHPKSKDIPLPILQSYKGDTYTYTSIFKLSGSLVKFKLCCSTSKALMMSFLFPTGTLFFSLTSTR